MRVGSVKVSSDKLLLRAAFFIGLLIINGVIVAAASSCDDAEDCISWALSLDSDENGEKSVADFDPPGEPDDRSDALPAAYHTHPLVYFYPSLNFIPLRFSAYPSLPLRPPTPALH